MKNMKIAIAGTGYVGMSNAILLTQDNEEVVLALVPKKCRDAESQAIA